MSFNFKQFRTKALKEFSDNLSEQEIDSLLTIEGGYEKDSPISTGKRLQLTKILFSGVKKHAGERFRYEKELFSGVNLWIADNLKGKSTLFKVIKFALTGSSESLKPQVKAWFETIQLEFKVGENTFSTSLNMGDGRLNRAQVFSTTINAIEKGVEADHHLLYEGNSFTSYEEYMQKFFFGQFSFYSLKWTQKDSRKEINELHEAGASWKTYYKTIYLESADSNTLAMASQNELVFQMLLGLELTSPINKLKVKRDLLLFKSAKLGDVTTAQDTLNNDSVEKLTKELAEVNVQIQNLQNEKITSKLEALLKAYSATSEQALGEQQKVNAYQREIAKLSEEANFLVEKENSLNRDVKKYTNEVFGLRRKITDIKEYLDLGIFFTNLDITSCPHCDHSITKEKKAQEKETHACMLCSEPVHKHDIDTVAYDEKVRSMQEEAEKLSKLIESIEGGITTVKAESVQIRNKIDRYSKEATILKNDTVVKSTMSELESQIDNLRNSMSTSNNQYEKLVEKKGELQYRLKNLDIKTTSNKDEAQNNASRIKLLDWALGELTVERRKRSLNILDRLKSLMLNELHSLGLLNFTDIEIDDAFRLVYTQHGAAVQFKDIVEGEKLRVKMAFYLSLIQLDVEFNFGRHPRFLVIDSPAKEEGDKKYLEGLNEVLLHIENKFSGQLQIFVGTAVRELEFATTNKKVEIKEPERYLF
ncbi:hypothetical protein [Rufibacter sp. LB8]|uniref:hypothetical protein n=1 Tax=Rufibacter sp. LB8 TaxID=2777781 RepID=UPI00178C49BF|nr:hypothetical protein [Rufibacter sp. LB8]